MTPFLLVALAAAPEPWVPWGLRWLAPPECRQAADVARAVEDMVKRPTFGANPKLVVDGAVERLGGEWRALIALVDDKGAVLGNREVSSREAACSSLDDNVTLVVALLVDPTATPRPSGPPPPAPAPALPPPPLQPREGLFDDGRRLRLTLVSDTPGVKLHRIVLQGTIGRSALQGTTVVCAGPCRALVPPGDRYFVSGEGVPASREFALPDSAEVAVQVRGGSVGAWVGGLLLTSFGAPAFVAGIVGLIVGALLGRVDLALGMAALAVGGAGMTLGGALLMAGARTEVQVREVPGQNSQPSSTSIAKPYWLVYARTSGLTRNVL